MIITYNHNISTCESSETLIIEYFTFFEYFTYFNEWNKCRLRNKNYTDVNVSLEQGKQRNSREFENLEKMKK